MNIPEHIAEAERLLELAHSRSADGEAFERVNVVALMANAHASMAIAKCQARTTPGVGSRTQVARRR